MARFGTLQTDRLDTDLSRTQQLICVAKLATVVSKHLVTTYFILYYHYFINILVFSIQHYRIDDTYMLMMRYKKFLAEIIDVKFVVRQLSLIKIKNKKSYHINMCV